MCLCVFVCLFWGFTPYLRPIFTQQPQGEITSYSPAPAVLSQRFHDNRRNVPSCLSACRENRERRGEEEEEEEAAEGDGEDTLRLECLYTRQTLMRSHSGVYGRITQECRRHKVTDVTGIRQLVDIQYK